MPELPEVETIRRGLEKEIINKKIVNVCVKKEKLVHNNLDDFIGILTNNKFIKIDRVGKLLILTLAKKKLPDNWQFLLIHLKMTGQLIYQKDKNLLAGGHNFPLINNLPNKFTHIILSFFDDGNLFFNDLRQFGYWKLVSSSEKEKIVSQYGIEPIADKFKFSSFQKLFFKRKIMVKQILLNQKLIAGLGNIYADEVCFSANILPSRSANTLSKVELKKIFTACRRILQKAIKYQGTTFSDYRDASGEHGNFKKFLQVYQRVGQNCLRCKVGIIQKNKINGRGTHFCLNCQK